MTEHPSSKLFTTLDATGLREAISRREGLCVLATVNEDGTPNAAIFVPSMPDDEHVAFVLAPNLTKTNIERTGTAWMVYDVAQPRNEEGRQPHAGARCALELVSAEEAAEEHAAVLATLPERMRPFAVVMRVGEIRSIG